MNATEKIFRDQLTQLVQVLEKVRPYYEHTMCKTDKEDVAMALREARDVLGLSDGYTDGNAACG